MTEEKEEERDEQGSEVSADDVIENQERPLSDIQVEEIDELTGQPIKYIVYSTGNFIVSIDNKLSLNWQTNDDYKEYAKDFGEVVGSVELSEALIDRIFSDPLNKMAYKKMLGSVIARILDDGESASARKLLAIVDERINEHGRERVRMIYIKSALVTVVVVALLLILILIFQKLLYQNGWGSFRCLVTYCSLLGGVGAFITTFARFNNYTGSLVAGIEIHRLDGFLRIFYGLIAGLIIILAIKANVVVGFANDKSQSIPWLFYFLAMIAGASEILIPNLVKQAEGELGIKKLEKKEEEMSSEKLREKEAGKADDRAGTKAEEDSQPGGKIEEPNDGKES
jgi:hypothetical protein